MKTLSAVDVEEGIGNSSEPRKRAIVVGFPASTAERLADMLTTGGFDVRYGRSAEYAALQTRIQSADVLVLSTSCTLGGTLDLIAQLGEDQETQVIVVGDGENSEAARPYERAGIPTRYTIPASCEELMDGGGR